VITHNASNRWMFENRVAHVPASGFTREAGSAVIKTSPGIELPKKEPKS
jgi:hypothetical protein